MKEVQDAVRAKDSLIFIGKGEEAGFKGLEIDVVSISFLLSGCSVGDAERGPHRSSEPHQQYGMQRPSSVAGILKVSAFIVPSHLTCRMHPLLPLLCRSVDRVRCHRSRHQAILVFPNHHDKAHHIIGRKSVIRGSARF